MIARAIAAWASWAEARRKHEVTAFAVAIGGDVPTVLSQVADHVVGLIDLADDGAAVQTLFAGVASNATG